MIIAYIALGSNLDNPINQLQRAIKELAQLPNSKLVQVSPFYQNPAVGPPQPDFINAVAELHTALSPLNLLQALQQIEVQHGRKRTGTRNEPRPLDLDIILYGNETIHEPNLTLPHPRFYERAFVLIPLQAIAPSLKLPNGQLLAECTAKLSDKDRLQQISTA